MATQNNINGSSILTQFTASGTWTKNPRTTAITIFGISSGSGAGSGRQGSTTSAGGAAGGNSSSFIWCERMPASVFGTSETVTIGGTSSGGATQSTNGNDGNTSAAQNSTMIGSIGAIAQTGVSPGGTSTSSAAVARTGINFIYMGASNPVLGFNVAGGAGSNTNGSVGQTNTGNAAGASYYMGTAGGGGSGANSATAQQAGNGGAIIFWSTTITAAGAGGIETGTINGGNGTSVTLPNHGLLSAGTGGGGGGGQKSGGSAGTGGNGGTPGGSGGGGGGSITGTNSGAGGTGQAGELWVIEFF